MSGQRVCGTHGGRSPQAKHAAARRLAEAEAARTLADVEVAPIGNPLEELAAVAAEARAFMAQAAAKIAEEGRIDGVNHLGDRVLTPFVVLYERMMDRTARMLAEWVRLGFDERMVALHERQAELVAEVIRAVLDDPDLGLTDVQRGVAPVVVRRHLEAVATVEVVA